MSSNPQVTVAVLADIKGLRVGMQEGERIVTTTTNKMARDIDNADIGGRFAKQAQAAIKGIGAITAALNAFNDTQMTATQKTESFAQALVMSGSKAGGLIGALTMLGMAGYEAVTGAQAKALAEQQERMEQARQATVREETADLERQLKIVKEKDSIKRIELELARELLNINRRYAEGEKTFTDFDKMRAEERLAIEKARQRIEEERKKNQSQGGAVAEGIVDTLTTSIGGAFRVAQRSAMAVLQQKATAAAEKTAENTRAILDLIRRGPGLLA